MLLNHKELTTTITNEKRRCLPQRSLVCVCFDFEFERVINSVSLSGLARSSHAGWRLFRFFGSLITDTQYDVFRF
jgi:hypothetical protein